MAAILSDEKIKEELLSLGVKNIGPITDSTRPLYVKKLLRLKTEQQSTVKDADKKRSTRSSSKSSQPRVVDTESSEESDHTPAPVTRKKAYNSDTSFKAKKATANVSLPISKSKSRNVKSPQAKVSRPSNAVAGSGNFSTFSPNVSRPTANSTSYSQLWDESEPSMKTAHLQTSINSTVNRTFDVTSQGDSYYRNEFSDSDQDDNGVYQPGSSFRSYGVSSPGYQSTTSPPYPSYRQRDTSYANSSILRSRLRESFSDQTGVMDTDGYKITNNNAASKIPVYASKILILILLLFFGVLGAMYMTMQKAESNLERGWCSVAVICMACFSLSPNEKAQQVSCHFIRM